MTGTFSVIARYYIYILYHEFARSTRPHHSCVSWKNSYSWSGFKLVGILHSKQGQVCLYVDNFYSSIKFNKFGIQQGLVLFLIYMNDIFSVTFQVKTAAIINDTALMEQLLLILFAMMLCKTQRSYRLVYMQQTKSKGLSFKQF